MSSIIVLIIVFALLNLLFKKAKKNQSQKLDNQDMFSEKNNDKSNDRDLKQKDNLLTIFLNNINQIQENTNNMIRNQPQSPSQSIKQDDLSYKKEMPKTIYKKSSYSDTTKITEKSEKPSNTKKVYKKIDIKNDEFETWKKSFYDEVDRYLDTSDYLSSEKLEK